MAKIVDDVEYWTTAEVVQYLGVSSVTFYKLRDERDIETFHYLGDKNNYYKKDDIETIPRLSRIDSPKQE